MVQESLERTEDLKHKPHRLILAFIQTYIWDEVGVNYMHSHKHVGERKTSALCVTCAECTSASFLVLILSSVPVGRKQWKQLVKDPVKRSQKVHVSWSNSEGNTTANHYPFTAHKTNAPRSL